MPALPQFTAQQAAAVQERAASVALSAGAGCGKTFVLTQRFLSHLEPGPTQAELRKLVAITFTDRAAREMRDRIRGACQQRLAACDTSAVEHWLQILRGLDTARISTIHSFCTSLLRAHAVEAGLDPRFVVLEPALSDTLLQSTTADTVHRLLIADDPDAITFVLRFGLAKTRDLSAQLARQRFRIEWEKWESITPEELAASWQHTWTTQFVPKLQERVRQSDVAARVRRLLADHDTSNAVMQQRRSEILQRLDPDYVWTEPAAELESLRNAARVQGGGSKTAWSCEDVFEDVKDSLAELRKELDSVSKQLSIKPEDIPRAAELAIRGVRLAGHVATAYAAAKSAAGVLDFDDLLLLARNLLRDNLDVRRRFAAGIELLLVDEFQDTDPVQAEIVRHLCGAALTNGRLFLVGDVKQSIYRFRRADPGVFESLSQEIPQRGRLSLTQNFRSQPEILHFVNLLFGKEFGKKYERLVTADPQRSPRPSVEFLWATTDAEEKNGGAYKTEAEGLQPLGFAGESAARVTVGELRAREADWIARRIAALLQDPTPRVRTKQRSTDGATLRCVEPGDIVILFRALTNVQLYEAALRKYGLDYYLVGGKAFYAQQEVFDLLNLCRCLDESADAVALVGVLRSPFFGLNDDAIHALHPFDGDWWSRLQQPPPAILPEWQQERVRFAARVLADLQHQKDRLPIAELLSTAIDKTGYDAALLAEHLGRRKVANLRKLIDQAATFDRGELFTLKDYVQRLQSSVLEQTDEEFATTLPETGGVIRLMSVHQAKGLEFPVVIVADVDRKGAPHGGGAYLHPDWGALIKIPDEFGIEREHLGLRMLHLQEAEADEQESLRLFYVAVTRAADHLILSAGMEPDLTPHSPWLRLLGEQFSLDTGLPKHDALLGAIAGAKTRDDIPDILVHRLPPVANPVKLTREHRPLSEFVPKLTKALPEPLPPSSRRFAPDASAPRTWSPSTLETLAAEIFPELRSGQHGIGGEGSAAEVLGTLLHAVLERVDFASPDRWEQELTECVRMSPDEIDAGPIEKCREMLARFAASELPQRLATAQRLWREFDFVLPWPVSNGGEPDLIAGQVDCCYVTAEGTWHLLDYKTGDYSRGATDAEVLAPYRLQLGLYALAAEQWWGRPLDTLELVLFRPTVRCVSWSFDAAARAQVKLWVDRTIERERQSPTAIARSGIYVVE